MKKSVHSIALNTILCALCAGTLGCVEADELPTKPNEPNVHLTSNVQDWRDEVIYQLIVDRFNNGDVNNDFNVNTRSMSRYHGGDWQGIIDKLDYLQELGVTTLWISPPVKNVEEDAGFASYHGYWTVDFLKHNPHFGDLATLRRLSDELHKRGMKLILDIVTNHVGQVFFYDINMNGEANEWLAGRGDIDKGSQRPMAGELSRVTEYDPDFRASGIRAYTSMGISGQAPIVFFDMPQISRVAPGPQNIDLNGDGLITTPAEKLGFANPNWYHQRGRTYDYDTQYVYNEDTRSYEFGTSLTRYTNEQLKAFQNTDRHALYDYCRPYNGIGDDGNPCNPWKQCTESNDCCIVIPKFASSPYTHYITNYDGTYYKNSEGVTVDIDGIPKNQEHRKYYQNDQTLLGDFPGGLKDVATEREDVRQAMIQVFSYWIDVTDCDGFRIDTLKHVEYTFWETFAPAIRQHAASRGKKNFFMYGEAFDGNDNLLAAYTENPNSVDSVFLFSQKYAIDQSFKCAPGNEAVSLCGKGGANPTAVLYGWDDGVRNNGGRHALFSGTPRPGGVTDSSGTNGIAPRDLLVNFLDNHDVGRYLFDRSDAKGVDSLKNALSFLILQRGIPCIYYGTEQGYMGGNDPGNREDMWDRTASIFTKYPDLYPNYNAWDTGNPIFKHIQKLIRIRNAVPVLRRGEVSNVVYSKSANEANSGIYAFTRTYEGKSAVIVVNTHETQSATPSLSLPWSGSSIDILNNEPVSGQISIPPMTTRVLIPEADRASYPL